jgi:hypothetical protein
MPLFSLFLNLKQNQVKRTFAPTPVYAVPGEEDEEGTDEGVKWSPVIYAAIATGLAVVLLLTIGLVVRMVCIHRHIHIHILYYVHSDEGVKWSPVIYAAIATGLAVVLLLTIRLVVRMVLIHIL